MITTLLVLMLMSALLVGFTAVVMSDQRLRFIDRDRGQAFYAASGAVEKLTADLGNLFFANLAPTRAQIGTVTASPPGITGVTYSASAAPAPLPASSLSSYYCASPNTTTVVGTNGYTITFCANAAGNPTTTSSNPIKSGPYEGLIAAQTPFQVDVTARTATGGEVHLIRTMEAVAIPVFQFGMFSDVDLSFFAGPNFDFGGRVHTNGSLFLSEGGGSTLTLRDKVTAVKEVVRQKMQNGASIDAAPAHTGTVSMAASTTTFRNLARTEGSVVDDADTAANEPIWHSVSLSAYNSWIRNGRTGAKALNLPLITVGGTNPDLIRRAPPGENAANPILFSERLFAKASLRILLSDTSADITNLPSVTPTPPVRLDGDWKTTPPDNGVAYGPVDGTHPPIARSMGVLSSNTSANTAAGDATISVGAIPAIYLTPQVTVTNSGTGATIGPFTCTGRTATSFTGCAVPSALTSGWPIRATSTMGTGIVTLTLNGNVGAGASRTLNLAAGQTTWAVAANTFWLGGTSVTCGGHTGTTQFTGCTGTPATTSPSVVTSGYLSSVNTGTIGGYLKIEKQDVNGVWTDVTMEILNYGIGAPNIGGTACADPTPRAILRMQRLRDNGNAASCTYAGSQSSYDWWPNVLFDTREALLRDTAAANLLLGGVMQYMTIDTANLAKWFKAAAPYNAGSGANAIIDNTGYTVYFSDRRNNRNAANVETGEYGFEDFVNPAAADGSPNGLLDAGEDVNGNAALDTYGRNPSYDGVSGAVPPGAAAPLNAAARPTTMVTIEQAKVNRALLFRRALKVINGANIAGLGVNGLTVVAENPVYIQGDWNAAGGNFNGAHAATAVIADAVTLLSNGWSDQTSFTQPYAPGNRNRGTQSWYRVAIIGGKGAAFPQPAGTAADFGTDGGAHNFLRYLENGDQAVNYRGSIATFFYNRQAVGTFKCCTTVYGAPTRNYAFDVDFLDPSKLPPNTPVFRDLNAVGFSQELRPGR